MPSVSSKQAQAMKSAAYGKSKLGIPQSVGKEFMAADKAAGKKFRPSGVKYRLGLKRGTEK